MVGVGAETSDMQEANRFNNASMAAENHSNALPGSTPSTRMVLLFLYMAPIEHSLRFIVSRLSLFVGKRRLAPKGQHKAASYATIEE